MTKRKEMVGKRSKRYAPTKSQLPIIIIPIQLEYLLINMVFRGILNTIQMNSQAKFEKDL